MIQVSSPTQGPGSPQETGYRQEINANENLAGISSMGAQKNKKLGVFAKLLQGLSVKLTKGEAVLKSEFAESSDTEEPKLNNTGKTTKKLASLAKNDKKLPFGMEIPNGEDLEEGFFNALMGEIGLDPKETKAENPLFSERLPEINQKNDLLNLNPSPLIATESEKTDSVPGFPENKALANEQAQSGGKGKNGRNANLLNVSFRETEAEFLKNQSLAEKAESGLVTQGTGKENAPPSETRGRKSRERLNVEVRDLRTGEGQREALAQIESTVSLKEAIESNLRPLSKAEIEIPVELDLNKGSVDGKSGDSTLNRTFEDALAAQLRGNLSADIVRDAAVIVRNGGEGTIRLSLRPASLGDVKIRLEMTENQITGHIILKSSEALRAFERELPVLEKAFKDSGFSETNLEMSLASDDSANGGAFGRQEERQERDFLLRSLAVSGYEAESEQSAISRLDAPVHGEMLFTSPERVPVNLFV